MSFWESIYKYESTTIQNDNEFEEVIKEIKRKYGNNVIEIWSDEYLEKLKNCNGYYFQKKNKNFDDLINEKMNNGNYNIWPLRIELLKDKNITNYLEKKKKSKVIRNEKNASIQYDFLSKKRNSTFLAIQESNDSVNLDNNKNQFYKIEKKIKTSEILKIKELELKIKNLELIILKKDEIIKKEKIQNLNLSKKLKELESKSQYIFQRKIELENEVKLYRKYYNFSEGEKLISIKFISGEQDINYPIIAKNTEKFIRLEYFLYEKYPKYMETVNYFLAGGKKINRNKTLEQNNLSVAAEILSCVGQRLGKFVLDILTRQT
mgnify:CR=1 FL=1